LDVDRWETILSKNVSSARHLRGTPARVGEARPEGEGGDRRSRRACGGVQDFGVRLELARRRRSGVAGGRAEERALRRLTSARQQSTAGGRSTGVSVGDSGFDPASVVCSSRESGDNREKWVSHGDCVVRRTNKKRI
jgi:hypothetical protein